MDFFLRTGSYIDNPYFYQEMKACFDEALGIENIGWEREGEASCHNTSLLQYVLG